MATLIICPVCETRYETQAVFPPEGRKVRCSKCGHVWQAEPVILRPEPAVQMAPFPQQAAPQPPPPQPAQAVNVAMRGFAGIAPAPPPPPPGPGLTQAETEADLAAQVAQINAEAMAGTPAAAPPV
ncbi:MAG: zinc-ribbon domain-containing protein [Methyloceanibacter sp.]